MLNINGKEVDGNSLEVDGVDSRDYPDFCDAYISYAMFTDGTELNEDQLDKLTEDNGDIVNELAHGYLIGAAESLENR